MLESGGTLAVVDPATGATRPLPTTLATIDDAIWGHDGRGVIAVGQHDGGFVIARVALDGATTVMARSASGSYVGPRLSPDGRHLAVQFIDRPFDYLLLPR